MQTSYEALYLLFARRMDDWLPLELDSHRRTTPEPTMSIEFIGMIQTQKVSET